MPELVTSIHLTSYDVGGQCPRLAGVREPPAAASMKPRLLDRVRAVVRARHYSRRTEGAYVAWIRRYILFHDKRHPTDMGAPEITRFLSSLAVEGNVAEAVYLADRIVVMTPHPGTVKADVRVALSRPRDPLSIAFLEYQKEIVGHLR